MPNSSSGNRSLSSMDSSSSDMEAQLPTTTTIIDTNKQAALAATQLFEFPVESSLPVGCCKLRVLLLFPLSLIQQVLLFAATIQDFMVYMETNNKLIPIVELNVVRSGALWIFFLHLLVDGLFIVVALYWSGVTLARVKYLWPIAGHHIGFSVLAARINFRVLDYMAGLAFVAFLSEFCVPLKLHLNYFFVVVRNARGKKSKAMWQLRLLFLEMFMSGACTFVAIDKYALLYGSADLLSRKTRVSYTIIISLAICYWTIQLVGYQRHKLERIVENLQAQPTLPIQHQTATPPLDQQQREAVSANETSVECVNGNRIRLAT